MNDQNEKIMTFEKKLLIENGYFHGLSFNIDKYLSAIGKSFFYTERSKTESNPELKQVIVYSILIHNGTVVRYRRGSGSGDLRLRGKYSLGFGGHISIKDGDVFPDLCFAAMMRELNEELSIKSSFRHKVVALLNDDSDEVGKVHFGIIIVFKLDSANIVANEIDILEIEFTSIAELKRNVRNYESWSKICIENIEKIFDAYHAI